MPWLALVWSGLRCELKSPWRVVHRRRIRTPARRARSTAGRGALVGRIAFLRGRIGYLEDMESGPAKVFEDREWPGDWRVEWVDDDGGVEVAIFSGPNARERALRYADRQYGNFQEVSLEPYSGP
jgi:hypothetical protein